MSCSVGQSTGLGALLRGDEVLSAFHPPALGDKGGACGGSRLLLRVVVGVVCAAAMRWCGGSAVARNLLRVAPASCSKRQGLVLVVCWVAGAETGGQVLGGRAPLLGGASFLPQTRRDEPGLRRRDLFNSNSIGAKPNPSPLNLSILLFGVERENTMRKDVKIAVLYIESCLGPFLVGALFFSLPQSTAIALPGKNPLEKKPPKNPPLITHPTQLLAGTSPLCCTAVSG